MRCRARSSTESLLGQEHSFNQEQCLPDLVPHHQGGKMSLDGDHDKGERQAKPCYIINRPRAPQKPFSKADCKVRCRRLGGSLIVVPHHWGAVHQRCMHECFLGPFSRCFSQLSRRCTSVRTLHVVSTKIFVSEAIPLTWYLSSLPCILLVPGLHS